MGLCRQVNRDYCLDLRRIPFCLDQQVLRGEFKESQGGRRPYMQLRCPFG